MVQVIMSLGKEANKNVFGSMGIDNYFSLEEG